MVFYIVQFLAGLASASSLFLVASGLSIIFGVTRVVNFAHGSFYMLGAFLAVSLVEMLPAGPFGFWAGIALSALAIGVVGVIMELVILRRIYKAPELFQLVATFGMVLVIADAALFIWGPMDKLGPQAPGFEGAIDFFGAKVPEYDLVVIVLGAAVLGLLWLLFNRTKWGAIVRAATEDREMLGALGVNQALLFTTVFFLGSVLAGLGGALQIPRASVNHHMDLTIIASVFVVVVVGGMGNIVGAFVAAVIICELNAFSVLVFPKISLVLMFIVMVVVLIIRPWGLFGKPERETTRERTGEESLAFLPSRAVLMAGIGLLLVLLVLPVFLHQFYLVLLTEVCIFALFSVSLHLIMGNGGVVSFGHAAYFGIGAYCVALLATDGGAPMGSALIAAPFVAAAAAALFGWFCVRLSGVYIAMLSLAFAQIVWSIAFQWTSFTGGENGIVGVWPPEWASSRAVFYYLTLGVCCLCILGSWRIMFSPFGYALRAARDSALRTEAIGINIQMQRWIAFIAAGGFAGVAGALYGYFKGIVDPSTVGIPRSIDALMMVLLGGVRTLFGPIVGSASFVILSDRLSTLDYWRAIFGAIIIGICVIMPSGIAGFAKAAAHRILPGKTET
jgi:branched-chain amino acid transport system permease protein